MHQTKWKVHCSLWLFEPCNGYGTSFLSNCTLWILSEQIDLKRFMKKFILTYFWSLGVRDMQIRKILQISRGRPEGTYLQWWLCITDSQTILIKNPHFLTLYRLFGTWVFFLLLLNLYVKWLEMIKKMAFKNSLIAKYYFQVIRKPVICSSWFTVPFAIGCLTLTWHVN